MKERTEGSTRERDDPRTTAREMLAAAEAEELREAAALRTTVNVTLAFFTVLVAAAVGWYGMNQMRQPGGGSHAAALAACDGGILCGLLVTERLPFTTVRREVR
jgi:hypothetical protein